MDVEKRQILDMNAFDPRTSEGVMAPGVSRRLANIGATSVLFYQDPIDIVSASGAWMTSQDGTRYLDFYNNVLSVGHCHPTVVSAICQQTEKLTINTRYLNSVVDDYLDALKQKLPQSLSNVALTCSGSEANDLALRVACAVTGKQGFIVTENAYHGNTGMVTNVSPSALKRRSLPDHVIAVPAPSARNFSNNIGEGFSRAIDESVALLEERGYGFAAFICDSVFSSDGVYTTPSGFLAKAVNRVHVHKGMFIADEVQPGFARTGAGFWGFENHNVLPDMLTMGKPMGNGYPMAGVATRPEYFDQFCDDVGYFNTFGGNPVAAAAGHAVLNVIEHEKLQENAKNMGDHLRHELHVLKDACVCISDVRCRGLFIGIEISKDGNINEPDPGKTSAIINRLRDYGVLIGAAGKFGNILKIRPPLCITQSEIDFFIDRLSSAIAEH
ncbi:MAG: aspartate aminotransferase family protein [Granulosicoccus sp.]